MPEFSVTSASVPAVPAVPREEELYPIREVSRLTGVNPVTLRAWERRYGLIQPTRSESGHRLYSLADIDAVRSILAWIERGVAVSKVGKILARSNTAKAPSAPAYDGVAAKPDWAQNLLVEVAYGLYLGGSDGGDPGTADPRGGELKFYYSHRHDDWAGGLQGVLGYFGVSGRYFFSRHWGLEALAERGSAARVSLGAVFRY